MEPEQGRNNTSEASLLSRREYLLTTGALASGILTAASGNAVAATSDPVDVSNATADHTWRSIQITRSYSDPVAIAPSLSYRGTNPASPRLRNVTAEGFDLAVEEWRYLDGAHLSESVGYVVTDVGEYNLNDGHQFCAGKTQSDHRWTSVSFSSSFSSAPIVFSNAQTRNGRQPVVTRHRNVSRSGMEVRLQEEEAEGRHLKEDVGFLAIEGGFGTIGGRSFEANRAAEVDSSWQTVSFFQSYEDPVFIADLQSTRGTNAATIRYRNLTADGVEVKVEEEQSSDEETAHLPERLGYLVVEGGSGETPTGSETTGYGIGEYGAGGYGK